jgi:anti-anti-sigma factor
MTITASPAGRTVPRRAEYPPKPWAEDVRIVVWLRGEHDAATAGGLAERLANAAALGHGDVVVDLSGVRFMDGAIVKVLVQFRVLLGLQRRRLLLRAPSTFAQRILDVCGLVELMEPRVAPRGGSAGPEDLFVDGDVGVDQALVPDAAWPSTSDLITAIERARTRLRPLTATLAPAIHPGL